jgi:hypothetical protein
MSSNDGPGSAPSVSVIIPTYQRRDSLRRAIESVLAQTYEDFELLVVDDGSTDGTAGAIIGLDARVRYVWQENRGVAAARNTGVRLAHAPIIAFLDSDDNWRSQHLAVVAEALARHPEAVLVCTRPRFLVSGRVRAGHTRVLDALPLLLVENFVGLPSSVAVRKSAFVAVGGFDEGFVVSEARELWLRLATQGPFCLLDRPTITHPATRGSLTELGRRAGAHVPADELMANKIAAEIARLERSDSRQLAARAQGRLHYAAALRGLVAHDEVAVSTALEEACRLLPELSREAYLVTRRIELIARDDGERLHQFATAATLWPEAASDTALLLRVKAILLALRSRQPRTAIRLARRWPLARTPAFFAHTFPLWMPLARGAMKRWTQRRRERVLPVNVLLI